MRVCVSEGGERVSVSEGGRESVSMNSYIIFVPSKISVLRVSIHSKCI